MYILDISSRPISGLKKKKKSVDSRIRGSKEDILASCQRAKPGFLQKQEQWNIVNFNFLKNDCTFKFVW